ncbi:MAG TPA: hypothetical protein VGF64_00165, partial [Acidimicrobiales bacterium]
MYDDLAKPYRDRHARQSKPPVGGSAETVAQIWDRELSEMAGRLVKGAVRRASAQPVAEHRGRGGFGEIDEMAE